MVKRSILILFIVIFWAVTLSASEYGYLYLESVPDSAEFFVDGNLEVSNFTPRLCTLLVGIHTVRLYRPYYKNASLEVTIKADEVTRSSISLRQSDAEVPRPGGRSSLKSRYGRLTIITTPPNATIYIDNQKIKRQTPTTIENLEVGRREIRLELDRLIYLDTLLILPDTTITLQLSNEQLIKADRIRRANMRVPINIMIDLPGCIYRWEKHNQARPEIDGVDPMIRIDGGIDGQVVLNHENLPAVKKKYDRDLRLEYKEMPDTSYELNLTARPDQRINFKIDLTLDERGWFLKRTKPHTVHKKYSVPADFNAGGIISVRITILPDGEVLFRYF
jgi:hypothetical protein